MDCWRPGPATRSSAAAPLALALLALGACTAAPDTGDLPQRAAVSTCVAAMSEAGIGEVTGTDAAKDDRYWEVRGTATAGTFRCVVSAVTGEIVVSSHGTG